MMREKIRRVVRENPAYFQHKSIYFAINVVKCVDNFKPFEGKLKLDCKMGSTIYKSDF